MIKALIDLNVILDFLGKRANHQEAAHIFSLCENRKIKGFVSAHEITTLAYFLTDRFKNKSGARNIIYEIMDIFTTIPINEKILRDALNSNISDYEDAVIEQAALKERLDYIISNNIEDFKKSKVKSINPIEFISILKNSRN